jgi:hypothetical protein
MKRPNFFLLGAPKSGSTALYSYLVDHPQIFFPRLKEPRFFADDFGDFREITTLQDYEHLYQDAPSTTPIIGDGSPWYLCSRDALKNIVSYSPNSRAVVILRNPMDMLPSLHNQFLFSFKETETDLHTAWNLQKPRKRGLSLPPSAPAPSLLQYGELTSFGNQLERLLSIWPAELLHVVLFDDLRKNPGAVYRQILDFLELEDDHRTDFPVVNPATAHRNQKIGWIFESPSSPVTRVIRTLQQATKLRSTGILAPLLKGNRINATKSVIDGMFREELVEYYREDIYKLGRLIGRDLSEWIKSV